MDLQPTVRHLLADATQLLRATSQTPRLDAELLLAHVLAWSRARLLAESNYCPVAGHVDAFQHYVQRRADLEPVAYLLGQREFFGLTFAVDQRVLVPRPETELLVAAVLDNLAARQIEAPGIADIGTGSGAIAVTLAVHLPQARVWATDVAPAALAVAQANAVAHGVAQRMTLLEGDLLEPLAEPVDVLVSNPPYTVLSQIDRAVHRHEPHLALDGGSDGLQVYRRLFAQAPGYLRTGGAMYVEIGATQAAAVTALARAAFPAAQVTSRRDLAGFDRIVGVQT